MLKLLKYVLEREGCQVIAAAGPGNLIEDSVEFVLANHRYLSVVALYPTCKHLFMTSLPIGLDGLKECEVIFKPFQLAELLRRIAGLVRCSLEEPEGVTPPVSAIAGQKRKS